MTRRRPPAPINSIVMRACFPRSKAAAFRNSINLAAFLGVMQVQKLLALRSDSHADRSAASEARADGPSPRVPKVGGPPFKRFSRADTSAFD